MVYLAVAFLSSLMRTLAAWWCAAALTLSLTAVPVSAQSLDTHGSIYTHGGTLTVATLTYPSGQRQLVLMNGTRQAYRLATRFSVGTSLSSARYGSNNGVEWLDFSAEDARYITSYRWFFGSGRLTYAAYNKRTGRTTRRN